MLSLFVKLVSFFARICHNICKHFKISLKLCLNNFDTIYDAPSSITIQNYQHELPRYRFERANYVETHYHKYFALHVITILYLFIDSLIILQSYNFDYFNNRMPELITHLMQPEKYWSQMDMLVLFNASGVLLAGLVLNWKKIGWHFYLIGKFQFILL